MDRLHEKDLCTVIKVNFDAETAEDLSGYGNHGVIVGNPAFVDGYDGKRAVHFNNPFGRHAATQYIRFDELKGIDLRTDDFTVMFWYRTICGGTQEWAASWHVTQAGWGVDMPGVLLGGVVFSNRDSFDFDATGIMAAQLPLDQYFAMGLTGERGVRHDVDGIWEPQDSRWHQITVVCSRSAGNYKVYVDGEEKVCADISDFAGQRLGGNSLVLGADILGQYGLGNAGVDEFELYVGAMESGRIAENYSYCRVKRLAGEIAIRLEDSGKLYARESKDALAEQVERTLAALESTEEEPFAEQILKEKRCFADGLTFMEKHNRLYDALKGSYEAFLAEPQKEAKLSMLLISDLHIRRDGDACATALETTFADLEAWEAKLDGILNPGDFAAGATEKVCDEAYRVINRLMERHADWQLISCFGNHETNYVSPEENYHTGAGAFWRNVQCHISAGEDRRFGKGVLDSVQNY